MDIIDLNYATHSTDFIIGVDEVGRGPLAGPVVSCACFVDLRKVADAKELFNELRSFNVTDSKKLTDKKRKKIIDEFVGEKFSLDKILSLKNYDAIHFIINEVSHEQIDEMNILQASLESMKNTLIKTSEYLDSGYGYALVDGNKLPSWSNERIKMEAIVKGDSKSVMIGLASIIAKEYRDELMNKYDSIYPGYGLGKHAGYPTKMHKEAIAKLGISPIHRKSFKGVKEFVTQA